MTHLAKLLNHSAMCCGNQPPGVHLLSCAPCLLMLECAGQKGPSTSLCPDHPPNIAAIYSQFFFGETPGSLLLPTDKLQGMVAQLVAAYMTERHSMASAVVHASQDLARMAQGSKALYITATASWPHLLRIVEDPKHGLSRYYTPLPALDNLHWASCCNALQRMWPCSPAALC